MVEDCSGSGEKSKGDAHCGGCAAVRRNRAHLGHGIIVLRGDFEKLDKTTRSAQKVSSHLIRKIVAFMEEDSRNIVHRTMTPQSPSK